MTYDIYYNGGGNAGPFQSKGEALEHAMDMLKGSLTEQCAEIRPSDSSVKGGFHSQHKAGFDVRSIYAMKLGNHSFHVTNYT